MRILLDTNFLLVPAQFRVDIYRELEGHELFTLDACIAEVLNLLEGSTKNEAVVALALVKTRKLEVVKASGRNTDDAILDYASSKKCAVATNDANLIKALKNKGVKVIRLRQKKIIVEE